MFTKAQIQKMEKGFHPSKTGRNENAMVGKGEAYGNRKERRSGLSNSHSINFKNGPKMQVIGVNRFLHFVQVINLKDGGIKKISHSILVKKPNN
jgi:hypothetical protein